MCGPVLWHPALCTCLFFLLHLTVSWLKTFVSDISVSSIGTVLDSWQIKDVGYFSEWINDYDVLKIRGVKEHGWMGKSIPQYYGPARVSVHWGGWLRQRQKLSLEGLYVSCVMLRSLDFICWAVGKGWNNFISTVTSIWVFFKRFIMEVFSHI